MQSRKPRILHIITQLELGGAQKNVLDLVRHLDSNRYDIYLVSSRNGPLVKQALRLPGVKTILLSTLIRPINPLADLFTLLKLISLFKKERIDLVHSHSSKAGILGRWAARFSGVPIIVHTVHGWSFHDYLNFLTRFFYISLERITAKFTDCLVGVSRSDIRKGLSSSIGREDRYTLIRYGIKSGRFSNCVVDINRKKQELGLAVGAPVVGMVAPLKPQKSPQDFVRAAALVLKKNPRTRFLLVGDGILRNKVERLIERLRLGKSFVLAGWRQDIPEIMSCLDVLVLSSLWEGSPRVFLEAMSSRLALVAYNVDGVNEVISDGVNGFLVKPRDYPGLAERINRLLADQALLNRLGQAGFNQVTGSAFQVERMLEELDKLYCSLFAKQWTPAGL